MRVRYGFLMVALLAVFAVSGCKSGMGSPQWYANKAAFGSTLEKPVQGGPDERTFVDPLLKGASLRTVRILPATVSMTAKSEDYAQFAEKFSGLALAGLKKALLESGRADRIAEPGQRADYTVRTEALVHISLQGGRVVSDPVYGDKRSRATVIFTVTDGDEKKIYMKYTTMVVSQWDYASYALEELEMAGAEGAADMLYLLERF